MKLTHDKFNETILNLTIQDAPKKMAYMILVEGKSSGEAAKQFSVSRQAGHRAALRVWRKYLNDFGCPEGWLHLETTLPVDLVLQVKEMRDKALKDTFNN